VLRRWYESLERGKPDFSLLAPDVVNHGAPPGTPPGIEGVKAVMGMWFKPFSDWRMTVEDMIAEGDKVAVRFTLRFKHTGDFQGIPATGKQVTLSGIEILHIKSGKLAEHWEQFDMLGLMQQLGAVPPSGPGR